MIKKLRLKFIIIVMGALLLVFISMFLTLNIFMNRISETQTSKLLEDIAANDGIVIYDKRAENFKHFTPNGDIPEPPIGDMFENRKDDFGKRFDYNDMLSMGRFFYVRLDTEGNTLDIWADNMFSMTDEEAVEYASQAVLKNKASGQINNLQYLVAEKDYGTLVIFSERGIELQLLDQLKNISLWAAGITSIVLFVIVLLLSGWAVKPVKVAFDKQRRFVSDASHELKTPLTIISANADVLQNEIGEITGLTNIKSQSERMNKLINDLLELAKTGEKAKPQMSKFDISDLVLGTTLEFESRIFEEGKTLTYNIAPDLKYTGDINAVRQITAIFIDNAIKHSNSSGTLDVNLKQEKSKLFLSVYNTGKGIPEEERTMIFERFYRSDYSRDRKTGGFGLGLAIAGSVAELNKWKIGVTGEEGKWVRFTVEL